MSTQSVLVILEQVVRNGKIEAAYVLGQESFYRTMLASAGLSSVFKGAERYPMIGREGLSEYSPTKVIILEAGQLRWYDGVWPKATKIEFISDVVMKRPGPRYDQILSAFRRIAVK
jgi:ABC-type Fe3+-hydroxamate transport system substrate-binding protein